MIDLQDRKELLLPAKNWFIFVSFLIALVINLIPMGKLLWRPDFVAIVLVFWCVHQPKRLYFSLVFLLGLIMDANQGVMLGQHALAYILITLIASVGARRILWFNLKGQMMHILPIFIILHLIDIAIHLIGGNSWPGSQVLLPPLFETLLWPVADFLLLIPQRRAGEKKNF